MGHRQEENSEAKFFYKINTWLMSLCGASWDNPTPFRFLEEYPAFRKQVVTRLQSLINSPLACQYTGFSNFISMRHFKNINRPWGWKDPRNTYTLDLWTDIFPNAKVLYITRHGVDVALSLRNRERELLDLNESLISKLTSQFSLIKPVIRGGFHSSPRVLSLDRGLDLWKEYMEEGKRQTLRIENAYEVKYEEFLKQPKKILLDICHFTGLTPEKSTIAKAVAEINPSRAYSYRNSDEFRLFAEKNKKLLARFEY